MIEHFKKLGEYTLIYGVSGAISALIGLILVPVLTRVFGPTEYGVIDLTLAIISFLSAILMMGFDSAVALHFYQAKDSLEKKKIISTGFYFLLTTSLIVIIGLSFFTKSFSSPIFKEINYSSILFIGLPITFFTLLYIFFSNLIKVHLQPKRFLYLTATRIILIIGLVLFFILQTNLGMIGVFYGYLIANIFASSLGFILTFSDYILSFSQTLLKSLLKFGLPLILAAISGWILHLADRFFLVNFTSLKEVGFYTVGVKISQILFLVIGGFQLAWGPFAFSIYKEKEANQTFAKTLTYFTIITSAIALFLTIFAKEIINIISTAQYLEAFKVVGPLSLAMVAYGSYFIVALGVNLVRKTSYIAWTVSLAAVLNIGLNFLLVPRFGMVGAAFATASSYCVSAYLLYLVSQHYYPIPFQLKKVAGIWILTILFMIVGLNIYFPNIIFNIGVKLLIFLGFLITLPALGILKKEEIALVFKLTKGYIKWRN